MTSIYNKLKQLQYKEDYPFHMPGHKRNLKIDPLLDAISKIERGERTVNREFIRTAAEILNCSVQELIADTAKAQTPAQKLVAALRNTADLMEQVYEGK